MTWKQMITSSIGKKLVMSFTGIFLILFLVVHAGLNACIWAGDNGEMFNKAAHFMGANVIPRVLEIGLFLGLLLHIFQGYMLELENRKKRSVQYAIPYGNRGSKWYSRSMAILGTLVLLFLILHLYQFWMPSRMGGTGNIPALNEVEYSGSTTLYHNLFAQMQLVFSNIWVVVIYVLGCIALGYHLAQGFLSAFRTFGLYNTRYIQLLKTLGCGFAILIPLVFIMMPISFYLNWV